MALALVAQPRAWPVPIGDTDDGNKSTNRIGDQAGVRSPHKHGRFLPSKKEGALMLMLEHEALTLRVKSAMGELLQGAVEWLTINR